MTPQAHCPSCGRSYPIPPGSAGKRGRCRCGSTFDLAPLDPALATLAALAEAEAEPEPDPEPDPEPARVAPRPPPWEYRMVQMQPAMSAAQAQADPQVLARSVQDLVTRIAADGWEFHRCDPIPVTVRPGAVMLLLSLLSLGILGMRPHLATYQVLTFRRDPSAKGA